LHRGAGRPPGRPGGRGAREPSAAPTGVPTRGCGRPQMAQQALAAAGPEAEEAQQLAMEELQELLQPEDLASKLVLNL
jgi:hypothetical protein